jgi:hypothetical protein
MHTQIMDAPAALGFVVSQRSHIEAEVMRKPYPTILYPRLMQVDTSANPFAASVTFFTQDSVGRAKFINGKGDDIPRVDVTSGKFEQTVNMAGVMYSYSIEEIGAAAQLNLNLPTESANAARMAYEMLVNSTALIGNAEMGIEGFFNTTGITSAASAATFALSTPQAILAFVNGLLTGVLAGSLGTQIADTVVMPIAQFGDLATRQLAPESDTTVLDFIRRANVYTAQTGLPLNIFSDFNLVNRMVVYRNDPSVVKLHMPMPLQFLAPQAYGLEVRTYGAFRFAPVSIRTPAAVRYGTGL